MTGMLPGVEIARRRRCHRTSTAPDFPPSTSPSAYGSSIGSRRSSFCLYTSNQNSLLPNSNIFQERSMLMDEKLGAAAREAKERLEERLRALYRKLEPKRRENQERLVTRDVQRNEVHQSSGAAASVGGSGLTKIGSRRLMMSTWAKLRGWKWSEQEECTVCLEQFRPNENLAQLPCAHRFHSTCLVPWLQNNAHCPCCRSPISSVRKDVRLI